LGADIAQVGRQVRDVLIIRASSNNGPGQVFRNG
jgi:hypothetical protein